jgi:hypothetical protein
MNRKNDTLGVLLDGAVAGVAATWLMGKVTSFLYERENQRAREREERARHGTTSYGVAAEQMAKLVGETLSDEQRKSYGETIHWALGAGAGAAYALLRNRVPEASAVGGLLFGTAFFLLMDEGLVYALGLTPGPSNFPWQAHARGLAGHLAYGAAAEGALHLMEGTA